MGHSVSARRRGGLARWLLAGVLALSQLAGLASPATTARAEDAYTDVRTYVTENVDAEIVDTEQLEEVDISTIARLRRLFTGETEATGLQDTGQAMLVKYTLVEDTVPDDLTIDELWDDEDTYGANAFIAQYAGLAPLYEVGDEEYYVAFVDMTEANGTGGSAIDFAFARNNDFGEALDDVIYDTSTGIAYVPKGDVEGDGVQAQLLVKQNPEVPPTSDVHVTVTSGKRGVEAAEGEYYASASGYDATITVPVATPETASKLDLTDITVYADGFDDPLLLTDETASYDAETGELTLAVSPIGLSGLDIEVGSSALSEAVNFITMPKTAFAVSATDMGFYPGGSIKLFKALKSAYDSNKVITYKGMCYSTDLASNSAELSELRKEVKDDDDVVYYFPGTNDATDPGMNLSDATKVWQNDPDRQNFWRVISLPGDSNAGDYSVGSADDWSGLTGLDGSKTKIMLPVACAHITRDVVKGTSHSTTIKMRILDIKTTGSDPYVVLAFCTSNTLDDGNASQVGTGVVKFHLKPTGALTLTKGSAATSITSGNDCYSLAGAEYTVYSDKACTEKVGTLKTDADGKTGELEDLTAGTYYVKETKAPKGYVLDDTVASVKVEATETATVDFADMPGHDPASVSMAKVDAVTGKQTAQGDGSLAGAQFTVKLYDNTDGRTSGSPLRTWVYQTNAKGEIKFDDGSFKVGGDDLYTLDGEVVLPLGTYAVQETKAPAGYLISDGSVHVGTVTQKSDGTGKWDNSGWDNANVPVTYEGRGVDEQPILGGLSVGKVSAETGTYGPQGDGSLEGATFTVTNRSAAAVTVGGKSYAPGEVVMTIATKLTDGRYVAATASRDLPYGTYEVRETKVADDSGYLLNGTWRKTVEVREDGKVVDLTSEEDACPNQVKRMDFGFTKKGDATGEALAGVPFRITSNTTGESHVVVTDDNGRFDTQFVSHGTRTNANDAAVADDGTVDESKLDSTAGVWFYGTTASDGMAVDDDKGALPWDTYTIEELRCSANDGYELVKVGLTMHYKDGFKLEWGTIDDQSGPEIHTTATGDSGTHETPLAATVTVTDVVEYTNLKPGKAYTMTGTLHVRKDGKDAGVLTDASGNEVTSAAEFTPKAANGSVKLTFTFDTTEEMAGATVVAFESCEREGVEVATHADITDDDQSVALVEIGTTLTDANGSKVVAIGGKVELTDTIAYKGLTPGKTYTARGTLVDKETGDAIDAKAAEATFTPEASEGTVEVTFTIDADKLPGGSLVAFERVLDAEGTVVGIHEDIDDEDQTVTVPEIGTTLTDSDGNKSVKAGKVKLVDVIAYEGLEAGRTYTAEGTLVDKETGEAIKGVTASAEFTPESEKGTAEVTFEVDLSKMDGKSVVAFEKVVTDVEGEKVTVATHEDPNDSGQTVNVNTPAIRTTLVNEKTGDHAVPTTGKVTVVDTIAYEGLTPGTKYEVTGELHVKKKGKDAGVLKSGGKKVTASATFTPTKANGTTKVTFTFDAKDLKGNPAVAFETLSLKATGDVVAEHKDIKDVDQTVTPKTKTTSTSTKTSTKTNTTTSAGSDSRTMPQTGNGPVAAILGAVGVTLAGGGAWYLRRRRNEGGYHDVIGGSH